MIIEIQKPNKYINGALFYEESGFNIFQVEDKFFLSGDATENELLEALNKHNPVAPTELTVAEKLASVGLSVDDLKAALGL